MRNKGFLPLPSPSASPSEVQALTTFELSEAPGMGCILTLLLSWGELAVNNEP